MPWLFHWYILSSVLSSFGSGLARPRTIPWNWLILCQLYFIEDILYSHDNQEHSIFASIFKLLAYSRSWSGLWVPQLVQLEATAAAQFTCQQLSPSEWDNTPPTRLTQLNQITPQYKKIRGWYNSKVWDSIARSPNCFFRTRRLLKSGNLFQTAPDFFLKINRVPSLHQVKSLMDLDEKVINNSISDATIEA